VQKKGYEVDTCNNGYDAIDMATEGGYDLIILDEMMPGDAGRARGVSAVRSRRPPIGFSP